MDNAEKLRELWEKRGNKNIKYSDRPQTDLKQIDPLMPMKNLGYIYMKKNYRKN